MKIKKGVVAKEVREGACFPRIVSELCKTVPSVPWGRLARWQLPHAVQFDNFVHAYGY